MIRLTYWLRSDQSIEFVGSRTTDRGQVVDLGGELRPNDGVDLGGLCYDDLLAYLQRCGDSSPTIEIIGGKIIPQSEDD